LTSAANSDQVWSVELPQGISRRGALQIIHHAVAVFSKEVQVESLTEYVAQLQAKVSKQSFISKCDDACASTPIDALGLEDPIATQLDDERIKRRMENEYKRIVEGIRQQRAEIKNKKDSDMAKQKAAEQLLIDSKPEDLLLDIVDGRVREGLRDNGFDDSMDDPSRSASAKASQLVASLTSPPTFSRQQKSAIPKWRLGAQTEFKEKQ